MTAKLPASAPFNPHQCGRGRSTGFCGGSFICVGCERTVGWCRGGGDAIGEDHCDDCYCDRLAVLESVKANLATRAALSSRRRKTGWQREPLVVADELREDGFLSFARNGRFVLTERAREALS